MRRASDRSSGTRSKGRTIPGHCDRFRTGSSVTSSIPFRVCGGRSIGGFVRQYQIDVDPVKLRAYNIPMRTVFEAVQRSNNNVGAKVIEANDREYVVRGLGLIQSVRDIEDIVLAPR